MVFLHPCSVVTERM